MNNQQQNIIKDKYNQKIEELNIHLNQLNATKNEYKKLIDKLKTQPDTLTQKVNVPLGKYAFFEGTITNTNEIMILLGDNYFAQRSCKQTVDIIQRRDNDIDETISNIKKQIRSLQQRFDLTSDLSKFLKLKEDEDIIEIKEEYDSDDEKEKEKIKKLKENEKMKETKEIIEKNKQNQVKIVNKEADKELDQMFNRLLQLEQEEEEVGSDYDEKEIGDQIGVEEQYSDLDAEDDESNYTKVKKPQKPMASEEYDNYEGNEDDEDYEEVYEYYDEDGNRVEVGSEDPNQIQYIEEYNDEDYNDEDIIDDGNEQGDDDGEDFNVKDSMEIKNYLEQRRKNFNIPQTTTSTATTTTTSSKPNNNQQQQSPKSILKHNSNLNIEDENNPLDFIRKVNKQVSFNNIKEVSTPNPPKTQAFSGDIVEKNIDDFSFESQKSTSATTTQDPPKVSRFKSNRLNK